MVNSVFQFTMTEGAFLYVIFCMCVCVIFVSFVDLEMKTIITFSSSKQTPELWLEHTEAH